MPAQNSAVRGRLGARIAERRLAKRLTQPELAERIGVSLRQLQRWETGAAMPYLRNLDQIAAALELEVEDLFLGDQARLGTDRLDQLDRIESKIDKLLHALLSR